MASHKGVLTLAVTVVLLALPSLTNGEMLHVRPISTNASCPTHPCLTLSEYAQYLGKYFNGSNLTLEFLPGTHSLNVNVTIKSIHRLEILGNSSAVVPTMIVCSSCVGIAFSNIYKVRIDGLAFVSCARMGVVSNHPITYYGLHLQSVQNAEIIDCTFQDSYGSALGAVDSCVVLKENIFSNNCRMCSNGGCDNFGTECDGGGIFVQGSNLTITGSNSFFGNLAHFGGGVSARYSSNVYISGNTTFSRNSASFTGGGVSAQSNSNVYISGSTIFRGNSARIGGGVCALISSNVYISGSTTFSGNSASFTGGGVFALLSSNVYISGNTTFSGNSVSGSGGVSALLSSIGIIGDTTFNDNSINRAGGGVSTMFSNLYINGSTTFSGNSARDGGGVSALVSGNVDISGNTTFSGNSASRYGGGVYALLSNNVNLSGNNTITANWAGSRGGGIYVQETKISSSGTGLLSSNKAQRDGGGIYADGSNLNFNGNFTIRNNTAQIGGAIYSDNNTINIHGHNIFEKNVANYYGGGIYMRRTLCFHAGNMFVDNSAEEGGAIYAIANSTLSLDGVNTFVGNRANIGGGGVWLDHSNLVLNGSNHFEACLASYEGGAIYTYASTASLPGSNTFDSNSATTGGGLHARWSDVSITERSKFENNTAVFGGGIFTDNSTFVFNDSITFSGNKANHTGGGIYAAKCTLAFFGNSCITGNHAARDGGGIYTRDGSVVNLLGLSNYRGNLAEDIGGGISAFQSTFTFAGQNTFESNKAVEGGGFYAFGCTVNFSGKNTFITNSASNHGGGFTAVRTSLHLNGSANFNSNMAASGGAMYITGSNADIGGNNCFIDNTVELEGGAISARDSEVDFNGKSMFVGNSARRKGAAIHSSFTTLAFQGNSFFESNAAYYGGGIYLESSILTLVNYRSSYFNNTAFRGGAQYFDVNSNFSLHLKAHVHFQDNNATEFGAAIYVVDEPSRSECFFYIQNEQLLDLNTTLLVFENNTAGVRGSVLYGGLLNKCNLTSNRYTSAQQLFNMSISQGNGDNGDSISSDPSQLCFCNKSELICTEVSQSRSIYPGQQVEVSVIAIDQLGSAIPALIHTTIHSGHTRNMSEIVSYETEGSCTSRNYSVTPKSHFSQLQLYPSNRSGDTINLVVNITFESCPIGFEQSNVTGDCICDHRLQQYTDSCNIDRQAILRNVNRTLNFWLGVSYNNGTPEGYIHHRYCPFDYCTSDSKYINLNNPDHQCNFNRSGLLCGKCKKQLSLVLGSSECKQCSDNYLVLLIPFALAGVLLVILLFLLNLTVAAGTLHGLIFYANIVAANHHIFFPHTTKNPASIFIAWLNLDLGIQTCFYNGMKAYDKTWLEFVFPIYIWFIVGSLAYISHHSVTMTKLLGSSPVSVLATLILLSYAKLLRTIIGALNLTILHYPNKDVLVWAHDANESLSKYIPLVVMALVFLLCLCLPYTLLLLLGQWLQPKSHLYLLSWVNNPKLKAILDTYHAPYKKQHRYWTGLLLLVRSALFFVFTFNISGDESVNLLVISSATSGIFAWLTLSGMVYTSWYLNALEVSFVLNLGILASATYHVNQSGGSQAAVVYISVGIAFLTFVGIVINHIYMRIKKVKCIEVYQLRHIHGNCQGRAEENGNLEYQCEVTPNVVTHTEVSLRELRSPLD